MPIYEYKGQQYDISETDQAAAKAKIQSYLGETAKQEPQQQPAGAMEQMFGAGSPIARFAYGAVGKPLLGINQLLAETGIFGEEVKQQARGNIKATETAIQKGRERVGSTGTDFVEIAGSIASPVTLAAPAVAAPTALGRVAQAAGAGALFAGTTPVTEGEDFAAEKLTQMGVGAVTGALVGAGVESASKAGKVVKDLLQPVTEAGRKEALREYLNKLAGPDREKVLTSLKQADELITGSKPTAAEAVSDIPTATGLASFQQRLARSMPEEGIAGQFAQREAQQQAARTGALRTDVAQTPELLDLARTLRASDASRNYGQAFTQTITADPKLAQIASNPYVRDALPDAIKLAEAKGISAKTDLTQFLQFVKIGLDKQLTRTGDTALSKTEKEAVQQAKKELVNWVGSKNPSFNLARESFAKASQPINQMEIGQFLEQRLGTALGDKERAGAFATAVQEAASTIKKASGQAAGQKLEDVLTPKQTATVNNILADLSRKAKSEELASRSNIGGLGQEAQELPNLLNRYATITNAVLKALKKDSNAEINRLATKMFLDPRELAAFMEGIPKSKSKEVVSGMLNRLTPENRDLFTRYLSIQGITQTGMQE